MQYKDSSYSRKNGKNVMYSNIQVMPRCIRHLRIFNKKILSYIPITEFFDPKAHTQAHSGGTTKFARAHWESP